MRKIGTFCTIPVYASKFKVRFSAAGAGTDDPRVVGIMYGSMPKGESRRLRKALHALGNPLCRAARIN